LFTGHYSFSFAGKSAERRIPLWLLFLAVQWIDVMGLAVIFTFHRKCSFNSYLNLFEMIMEKKLPLHSKEKQIPCFGRNFKKRVCTIVV
jgi:hypothetical protein